MDCCSFWRLPRPRLLRVAWVCLFAGIALLSAACIIQHCTSVSSWYFDLDRGWAGGYHPVLGHRVQGLTSYINLTAAMLAAALPCWLLPPLLRQPADRRLRALLLIGGVATAAALWYTDSRGPMAALALAGVPFLWYLSQRWGKYALLGIGIFLLTVWPASPLLSLLAFAIGFTLVNMTNVRKWRLLLAITIGLVFAGGLQVMDAYVLHKPLRWRVIDEGLTDRSRLILIHQTCAVIRTSPWWGVGEEELNARLLQTTKSVFGMLPFTQKNAHNQYLQWAASEGIPVALAFTVLLGWTILWLIRASPGWSSPSARALGLAAAMGMLTFLLCNLTDAQFWRIEGGGFYWSIVATVTAIGVTGVHNRPGATAIEYCAAHNDNRNR